MRRAIGLASLSSLLWAAPLPPEWSHSQDLHVEKAGLVRVAIPLETLAAHQNALMRLRVTDRSGKEIPYLIYESWTGIDQSFEIPLQALQIQMEKDRTRLEGQVTSDVGALVEFDRLRLKSPAGRFLKPTTLEASIDHKQWVTLLKNVPLYKEAGISDTATISFPRGKWRYFKLTLGDQASPAIPIQQVTLLSARKSPPALMRIQLPVVSRSEENRTTLFHLQLPAELLMVESVCLQTAQPTFLREVTLGQSVFSQGAYSETRDRVGTVHRINSGGRVQENLCVDLDHQIESRQLNLRLSNGDSPPLPVSGFEAKVYPTYLAFDAPASGDYSLWLGNPEAPTRDYDLKGLREPLSRGPFVKASWGPLSINTAFQKPDAFAQVAEEGTPIDLRSWPFRKKVVLRERGIQRLTPDLEALPKVIRDPSSIRLVRENRQIPFIRDDGGTRLEFQPVLSGPVMDGRRSRWTLKMPSRGLPVEMLSVSIPDPLFSRDVQLWEEAPNERGEPLRRYVGQAHWARRSAADPSRFEIRFQNFPVSDTIILETDNADNAPIAVTEPKMTCHAPRFLFKAAPGKDLYFYYGSKEAVMPRYDLELLSSEIKNTVPQEASLLAEESLTVSPWWDFTPSSGSMKFLFWGILVLVVAGLLVVIAKLLPEP